MKSIVAVAVVAQTLMVMTDMPPQYSGPCQADFPSYFFDKVSSQCEEFIYNGCGGNANRFYTLDDCKAACAPCTLPAEPGPCDANIPSYFYNKASGQCEQFIYSGCGGNVNRFDTLDACNAACHK